MWVGDKVLLYNSRALCGADGKGFGRCSGAASGRVMFTKNLNF